MDKVKIMLDSENNKVVVIPKIIFKNKQNIDWRKVEKYLARYVGDMVEVIETKDIVHIGKELPSEYSSSEYTKRLKGGRAKTKANVVQGIREIIETATNKKFSINKKEKHAEFAQKGWYYFNTRFAMPVYDNDIKTESYNIYSGCVVVNHSQYGKLYFYDLVDIKKEASKPLMIHI
ncbi:MAG: hypothetical protein R3Y40_06375 [Eubacteriales bacterium]